MASMFGCEGPEQKKRAPGPSYGPTALRGVACLSLDAGRNRFDGQIQCKLSFWKGMKSILHVKRNGFPVNCMDKERSGANLGRNGQSTPHGIFE